MIAMLEYFATALLEYIDPLHSIAFLQTMQHDRFPVQVLILTSDLYGEDPSLGC